MLGGPRPPSSKAASSASSGRRGPTSTCASSPRSRRCRATAGRSRRCSARSTSRPNIWPTAAVIDWLNILKRVDGIPDRARRLDEAKQILRGRLTYAGTTLKFSTEESDFWWWLMDSADANAARLILAVLDDPAWKDDLPRWSSAARAGSARRLARRPPPTSGARSRSTSSRRSSSRRRSPVRPSAQIELPAPAAAGVVGARRRLGSAAGGRSRDPGLAGGSGHAHGRAARNFRGITT